jgi:hypothetical protein
MRTTLSPLPERIDFAVVTSGVIVTKFWLVGGRNVAPNGAETKPAGFDLDDALAWCEENDYTVRRWKSGARAWKGDKPQPIRTRSQIWRRRTRAERWALRGDAGGSTLGLDFALDG